MEATDGDLVVVFETQDGYTISAPPEASLDRDKCDDKAPSESPDSSPPSNTSTNSSDATPPKKTPRTSRSRKSLPQPATDNSGNVKRIGGASSFAFGLLLGVLPFLIIILFIVSKLKGGARESRLQERWFKYGRSAGLIVLLIIIVVLLVKLT